MRVLVMGRKHSELRTWILDGLDVVSGLNVNGIDLDGFVTVGCREGAHSRLSDRFGTSAYRGVGDEIGQRLRRLRWCCLTTKSG